MIAFAQAHLKMSADDRAGKVGAGSELLGVDGQVFARAGHFALPHGQFK